MPLKLSPTQLAFNARGDGSFNTPFAEQLSFFRQKLNLPTERYDDILGAAHDRAFVVAGAAKADLLNDLRKSVDKAISEGKSIGAFRREFAQTVKKHGWEGWTGSETQAGRDWRTRVIYTTNLSSSYAAGRWAQLNDPELLQRRPYWKYLHNDSVTHPRELHQSWSGLVLKHDDPWWQVHFPPNGWGCRCRVTAVRERDYKGHPPPSDGFYEKQDSRGNTHTVPKGVDFGWNTAAGSTWFPALDKHSYRVAKKVVADYAQDGVFARWHDRLAVQLEEWRKRPLYKDLQGDKLVDKLRQDGLIPREKIPVGIISPEVRELLGAESQSLFISADTLIKQLVKREAQAVNVQTYLLIQGILDSAQVVKRDGKNRVAYWRSGDQLMMAVIKTTLNKSENYLLSIREANKKELKKRLTEDEIRKLGL